ncbi:hypothetical protein HJC23_009714 [Cyclotella cryptica]|uniref:Uncharacterized protein n=1 Tax=Cyclotella cryptica TaxID=29204 RepID=A0ABD3Q837_9STRA
MFFYNELKPLLARISSNSADLRSIQLSHKKITDKNLLQISDALQTNSNVNEIWLTNNLITEVGSLTAALESNSTVGELYLGGNKLGDRGGKMKLLRDYFARFCFRGDRFASFLNSTISLSNAASCIAALIQRNSTITDMGIEENNISDAGARMLADALSHNSTLQTLKLNGNNIDSFDTMIIINEKLKKNKDCAKKKLLEEHPEYEMQKIKKEKKKSRRSKPEKEKIARKSDDSNVNADTPKSKAPSEGSCERARIRDELPSSGKSLESNVEPSQKLMTDKLKSGLKVGSTQNSASASKNKREGTFC